MNARSAGSRVKVVKKRLADGSIREYRYDLQAMAKREYVEKQKGAIHKIALAYYRSPEYAALSEMWQRVTKYYVALIEDDVGWMTYQDLANRSSRADFFELRDKHAAFPSKADKVMNVLRTLLNFAYDRTLIEANHAIRIPKLVPSNKNRAENIWKDDVRQQFLAKAEPCLQRLFMFALYTGARQSDICAMKWSNLSDDGWLVYQPAKTRTTTGIRVSLPVFALNPLDQMLKSLPRPPQGSDGPILLTDSRPRAWTPEHIIKLMRVTKAKAGIEEDLTFHDIRGTCETSLLEAGCSEAEANSVLGHILVSGSGARNYAARSRKLALNAYRRWDAEMRGEGEIIKLARL